MSFQILILESDVNAIGTCPKGDDDIGFFFSAVRGGFAPCNIDLNHKTQNRTNLNHTDKNEGYLLFFTERLWSRRYQVTPYVVNVVGVVGRETAGR